MITVKDVENRGSTIWQTSNGAEITDAMLDWFGDGEVDVRLMLVMGVVEPDLIYHFWRNDPSSPGYHAA